MLTLVDITDPGSLHNVPRIDSSEIRLLWHSGYWDGPRSGMLLYRAEECWFEVIAESEDDAEEWNRRFVVLRLSAEQRAEELRWHELFREKVGLHTDYDAQGQRSVGSLQPRERWNEFYDAYRQRSPRDFSDNEVLAWFEW
ncbi:MAG: hypothetical protein HYS12_14340 [Planctomycetes bacterium]|nr:hypothetical protein [Planctomycetota bacterium]